MRGFGPSLPNIYPVENSQRVNRIVAYASRSNRAFKCSSTCLHANRRVCGMFRVNEDRDPCLYVRATVIYALMGHKRQYERNENSSLSRGNTAFSFISKFNLKSLESKIAKLLSLLISNNCKLRIFSF